jgi:hypothetical protein
MAVTAGFVIVAAMVAERAGAAIGALIATLPVAAGPSYVFLALDYDASFISQSAIGSIAAHAATAVFSLAYIVCWRSERDRESACRRGRGRGSSSPIVARGGMDISPWPRPISRSSLFAYR